MKSITRITLVSVLLFAFGGTALAPVATAEDNKDKLNIVQLGDSYSAGNGALPYTDDYCKRSNKNYGKQTADAIGANYRNVACSGAVSGDIMEQPQHIKMTKRVVKGYWLPKFLYSDQYAEWQKRVERANLCGPVPSDNTEWEYRQVAPAPAGSIYTATLECHLYNKKQIDAITPETDMVFLTIGGNDAGFFGVVVGCLVMRNANLCEKQMKESKAFLYQQADHKLTELLLEIEKRSAGNAKVYLLGYPDLLNTDSYTLPEGPAGWYNFGAEIRPAQRDYAKLQQRLIDKMNKNTRSNRYHYLDVSEAFAGHGLDPYMGANQDHSFIVPPLSTFDYYGYMHPNQKGWDVEAKLLTDLVKATK